MSADIKKLHREATDSFLRRTGSGLVIRENKRKEGYRDRTAGQVMNPPCFILFVCSSFIPGVPMIRWRAGTEESDIQPERA